MKAKAKICRPLYEGLRRRSGWPCLDDPAPFISRAAEALTGHCYTDAPETGTVEGKAVLVLTKLTKWIQRQAAAQRQLAAVLTALQRPGSRELKRELAELIEERIDDYRLLEDAILEAINEVCE